MKCDLRLAELLHVRVHGWGFWVGGWGKQGQLGMEPVVRVERGQRCSRVFGVVVGKLGHGQEEAGPVGLLVVAIHAKILLQHRIQPLRLAIRLGWKADDQLAWIPISSSNLPQKCDVKMGSRSLTRVEGTP